MFSRSVATSRVWPTAASLDDSRLAARKTKTLQATSTATATAVVASPVASLHVRTELESGQPLRGLWPRLRFNGQFLPEAVLRLYASQLGVPLETSKAGDLLLPRHPAGRYELQMDGPGFDHGNQWTPVTLADGEVRIVQHFSSN